VKKDKDNTKFIANAHKRFDNASDSESRGRRERLDDLKFVRLGEQWPEAVKRDRERPGAERPMLTINRLFQFRNQIINEIRQNRPSIQCRPIDDAADVDTAEVLQGIIRHIQDACGADTVYDIAAEFQVDSGLGYFRIQTDYCYPDSFDQDIIIKAVVDPFKVYFDPESTECDGSDAKWAFVVEEWTRDDFETSYPDVDVSSWNTNGPGDSSGWFGSDSVRIAEYFLIETKQKTLCQLQDGSTAFKDEIPAEYHDLIEKERKTETKVCKWYKLAGDIILDETELPCSFIPVIPVYGSDIWIEGKRHLHGLTRFAKDPARLYNFFQSANAETLALAPRAPYIAAEGQIDGYEQEWQNANRVNLSVLTYNPVSLQGNVLGAPRREQPPGTNPGFESAMNRAELDIKATMGMYDASMGNHESNQSGRAILSQQRQASTGNFHFSDNLARSLRHAGRIIIEMIPKIYDTQRIARIIGEDGEPKNVQLDPNQPQAKMQQENEQGEIKSIYNLGVGKYDVTVAVGPSYATKRQEAAESMMAFVQADPQVLQIAGDLIVKNMDWPGADEIAKRMKLMLPPQIQQAEKAESEEKPQIDPQMEQQMNQMADQMQHMSEALQQAQSEQQVKMQEQQMKMQELEQSRILKLKEIDEANEIKRFEAETKRMQIEADIAIKDAGMLHNMATADLAHRLSLRNAQLTDSAELDENGNVIPWQETPEPPHPEIMAALQGIGQMHQDSHNKLVEAMTRKKTIVRDPKTNKIIGVE